MDILSFISVLVHILVSSLTISLSVDSIALSHSLTDGMTIVSQGGTFELGFFSPGKSKKHYLGIWYKNISVKTVVWVANRVNPINDSSGTLTVNRTGHLVLHQNDTVVWNTTSPRIPQNPMAELLDSGNLVVRDENDANPEAYLWQSFDYPCDTLLPGMKFGWDLRTGFNWTVTAWNSPDDPAPGDFSCVNHNNNYPDTYLMKGTKKYSRLGPWNGLHASGTLDVKPNPIYYFKYFYNKDELYNTYYLMNSSVYSRLVINQTDYALYRYVWVESDQNWMVYKTKPLDYCDHYGLCGANGNCVINESPICQCLKGFRPESLLAWNTMEWSQGCVRNKPLRCNDKHKDGFVKLKGLKVPDTMHSWLDETIDLEECRAKCMDNCSCMAYTNSDIRGQGSGCAMWFGNLIDVRQFAVGGQDLYIRMDASELEAEHGHRKKFTIIVGSTIAAISGMILVCCCSIYKFRRNGTGRMTYSHVHLCTLYILPEDDLDLPLLDLSAIASATNNFSMNNKIGEGGFGPVYKGRLGNGKEIAVKRLSRSSTQGIIEFKNEVKLIAKLQHRNLVKLLGCCIQGEEKMLIYEYMPNSSLDTFIFDHNKGKFLDWSKRYHIICGIARGLMYLHQDSRLMIIHRDLKASNVLLDDKLNPKISDFGMAKSSATEQNEGNTNRIVGTYGYMAPEYAAYGRFSVKSDVFSFGILVLEIVYGKRNRDFCDANRIHNLIGQAWLLWMEGKALEMIDKNLEDSWIESEVLRCIHISLLCAQQHPEDRPTMSYVVLMLGSEIELPKPKEPGFFTGKASFKGNCTSNPMKSCSNNEVTITSLQPR
ncbi:G-type lectin S-receptor-like serine/threonine-protein kinase At4g27290 [Gastrolobium bilobum]|uniref:G-type lectin S-receptor-like serine/threonine-protein kinase At4g27290 n=1 Tax=Gastrolobium bilobum TaxID=150636 RepID=UPI002AB022A1|nr:G-type lectin S-receptor-like serine/threonine-protein kinase At4g27290 [Gastrolobium bilobum]